MKKRLLTICMAVLLLAGCGGGAAGGKDNNSQAASSTPSGDWGGGDYWDMTETAPGEPDAPTDAAQGGSEIYQNTRAKLIRRAELNIQTEQFDQSVQALNQLVSECGGYFEMASINGGGRRDAYASRSGEYIVRVPAEKYGQFFHSAGDLGYVTSSTESSEDVGERYYDTEARLKTQRTKQERLLALLERAETMEDIIALESALSDVEYQIEMYSSELNRFDALIGFSTFTLYIHEVGQITQEVGEASSLGQRMAAGVEASFRNLVKGFQDLLVWVSYHLFLTVILAAVLAVAVVLGRRWLKMPRRRGKTDKGEE